MGNWSSKNKTPPSTPVKYSNTSPVHVGSLRTSPVIHSPVRTSTTSFSYSNTSPVHVGSLRTSSVIQSPVRTSTSPSQSFQRNAIPFAQTTTASYGISVPQIYSTPASTSVQDDAKPVPKSPVVGNQSVKHSVNNYLIPKVQEHGNIQGTRINMPYKKYVDKFTLRVCPQYNSRNGCHAAVCRRFHVCYYWVQEKCHKTSCDYDHSFGACHNQILMNTLSSRRDFNVNMISEALRNNHRYNRKTKRNEPASICMFNIMRRCNQKPCILVHANKSYVWEVMDNDKWLQLAHEQSNALEQLFCQPDQDDVKLPATPNIRAVQQLRSLLTSGVEWQVNFNDMQVSHGNMVYDLRRLSTPSDICCLSSMNRLATRWVWYWQDDNGLWIPYTDGCGSKFYLVALSDQLEHQYNFGDSSELEVTLGSHSYRINVSDMTQFNIETGKWRNVKRRPSNTESDIKELFYDEFFSPTSKDETVRHTVHFASPEFDLVSELLKASICPITVQSVERVVNNHLWKSYQNKKDQLKALYQGDLSQINEQYLFHGTKHSVIDQICNDNFDWRLYGTNVGNVYGHGVYFSNQANVSSSYSESDSSGVKVMFIVMVLVGSMTIGDSSMKFPPRNPKTNRCFDTTCDDSRNSRIFVKYNRDEYYPAYIARYK